MWGQIGEVNGYNAAGETRADDGYIITVSVGECHKMVMLQKSGKVILGYVATLCFQSVIK